MLTEKMTMKIPLHSADEGIALFGPQDQFMQAISEALQVQIMPRDNEIVLKGEEKSLEQAHQLCDVILSLIRKGFPLTHQDLLYAIELAKNYQVEQLLNLFQKEIGVTHRGKPIRAKTIKQQKYVSTIQKQDVVFGVGPAGTGKTYLAVVLAVLALKEGRVKKIILTRPAVEAGENLGFLPGDLQEKVDPYLRPLYDALYDVMGYDQVLKALERKVIEIAPLAYMRGRTLEESFIILDEAQNTTPEQMKMFLTRLGVHSKMVVTGDITQIDLPRGKTSGLVEATKVLSELEDIGFIYFEEADVVRHSLVQKIIHAYEKFINKPKGEN